MYIVKECYTSLVEYSIKQYPRGSPLSTPAVCIRYLKETSCPYGEENFRTSCLYNETIMDRHTLDIISVLTLLVFCPDYQPRVYEIVLIFLKEGQ